MTDEKYAYGDWNFEGEECPVSSSGVEKTYTVEVLAEEYDDAVKEITGHKERKGVVSKDVASEAWEAAYHWCMSEFSQTEHEEPNIEQIREVFEIVYDKEFSD